MTLPYAARAGAHTAPPMSAWRPAWALLLAAGAHLGLFLALGGTSETVATPPGPTASAAVSVELKAAASAPVQTPVPGVPAATVGQIARAPQPAPAAAPSKPRYFEAGEWTDAPVITQDIAAEQMLVSPRLTASALRITLFINEQGGIDRVALEESALPEFEKQLVHAAFAGVRFKPARLRGLAVKSRLSIELTLENSRPEVAPG